VIKHFSPFLRHFFVIKRLPKANPNHEPVLEHKLLSQASVQGGPDRFKRNANGNNRLGHSFFQIRLLGIPLEVHLQDAVSQHRAQKFVDEVELPLVGVQAQQREFGQVAQESLLRPGHK
jgi:hypothetical protein